MSRCILVGTDLTHASDDAVIEAEALATRDGLPLIAVHVVGTIPWDLTGVEQVRRERLHALSEELRAHVTTLTGRSPADFRVLVECGQPHRVLGRLARVERALLVVGSHLHASIGHALVKNVGERVARRAYDLVLVARPRSGSGRILVAADHPAHSRVALQVALEEANRSGRKLTVLHCLNTGFVEGLFPPRPTRLPSDDAVRSALHAAIARSHVAADLCLVEGPPQALISDVADRVQAELIVIGASHRAGVLSDVTSLVLRRAQCSVLVVDDELLAATGLYRPAAIAGSEPTGELHP